MNEKSNYTLINIVYDSNNLDINPINNYLKDNFIEDYFSPDNEISFNNKSDNSACQALDLNTQKVYHRKMNK
jgi:hypothetical protein